jgi:hypothetical protein
MGPSGGIEASAEDLAEGVGLLVKYRLLLAMVLFGLIAVVGVAAAAETVPEVHMTGSNLLPPVATMGTMPLVEPASLWLAGFGVSAVFVRRQKT